MLSRWLRSSPPKRELTEAEKFRRSREVLMERLVTYIVRMAVHRGSEMTRQTLLAYADLLEDEESEVNDLVRELQEELNGLLGQPVDHTE